MHRPRLRPQVGEDGVLAARAVAMHEPRMHVQQRPHELSELPRARGITAERRAEVLRQRRERERIRQARHHRDGPVVQRAE